MKNLIAFIIRYIPRKYLQRVAGIGLKLLSFFYTGANVTCPVCGKGFRKFLPYGRINPRPNALCPNCMSLERHRAIWLYLREKTNFFKERLRVLHVAPEACFMKAFEKQHGEGYVTADIESPLAKVRMDIHDIPFEAESFDAVLCNHVLEHVNDDLRAMGEIARVLKPGGYAILLVPFFNPVPDTTVQDPTIADPRERERRFGQDDHVRKYGNDYPRRIERAGMKPLVDHFIPNMSEGQRTRYGLSKGEVIYGGVKAGEL